MAGVDHRGAVLVIDDERGVRATLRMLISAIGFDVIEAENGRQGIERFARDADRIVAVLLDMTMPFISGEEVFRAIRSSSTRVPVILSSGYDEVEATRQFREKGLAGFLQKPYTPDELARKLDEVLATAAQAQAQY